MRVSTRPPFPPLPSSDPSTQQPTPPALALSRATPTPFIPLLSSADHLLAHELPQRRDPTVPSLAMARPGAARKMSEFPVDPCSPTRVSVDPTSPIHVNKITQLRIAVVRVRCGSETARARAVRLSSGPSLVDELATQLKLELTTAPSHAMGSRVTVADGLIRVPSHPS